MKIGDMIVGKEGTSKSGYGYIVLYPESYEAIRLGLHNAPREILDLNEFEPITISNMHRVKECVLRMDKDGNGVLAWE